MIEKNALTSENFGYKGTFKTLEKELKKAIRERDELADNKVKMLEQNTLKDVEYQKTVDDFKS